MSEEERNAYLVVAALIATATYQAALSPPGGLYPSDVGTNNNTSHVVASTDSINDKSSIPKDGNSSSFSDTMYIYIGITITFTNS